MTIKNVRDQNVINMKNKGLIKEVIGVVIDVEFTVLPEIKNALLIINQGHKLYAEVQQHLNEKTVRALVFGPTEGLSRGMEVTDMGDPVSVPVGEKTLGRIFNVLGEPIDLGKNINFDERWPIYRNAPLLGEQKTTPEVFETGIKVIDLICPFVKGGKVAVFGGAGVGKTV